MMKNITKQLLTCKDNETYDVGRFLWAISTMVYLALGILAVMKGQTWQPMEFGTGLSAILAGGGISIAVKNNSEPGGST